MATWSTQAAFREYQMTANGEMTVVERLATLLNTGQMSDVTVRVGKGTSTVTFKAHKLLLATASQPLHKIVSNGIKSFPGDINPVIRFSDVDPKSFQHVLKYIYTDTLTISNVDEALDLLKVSKKWCLAPLTEKTLNYLTTYVDDFTPNTNDAKNDICNLLAATEDNSDATELNQKCWKIMLEKASEIIPCQGFLNLPEAILRKLLSHKKFEFPNHLVLFEAIRDWGMNQVIQRSLSVNELQAVIGDLLQHVDFKSIQDLDFMSTILPSECLSKADMIAFFMSRGMEIPRDFASSNNNESENKIMMNGAEVEYEKACRFKRGYKIPAKEICQEHELRFRVDKKLRLLGVGFGFLFSNTDMGVTIHCQGPWEERQWTDITQAYCRVTWEKMKTADVKLMFNEPVIIQANQSYKILVKVGRMSSGSTEVDLWGGSHGTPMKENNGTEFFFLKAATNPNEEVDKELMECKPGMITDLIYQLCDGSEPDPEPPKNVIVRRRRPSPAAEEIPIVQKPPVGDSIRKRPSVVTIEEPLTKYNPTPYQRKYCSSPEVKTYELPWQSSTKKTSNEESRYSYLRPKTSFSSSLGSSSGVGASSSSYSGANYTSPSSSRKSSNEDSKWDIPRSRPTTTDTLSSYRSRHSPVSSSYSRTRDPSPSSTSSIRQRDSSASRVSDYTPSTYTSRYRSRYGTGTSSSGTGSSSTGIGSSSSRIGTYSSGIGSYSSGTGTSSSSAAAGTGSSSTGIGSTSSRYGSSPSGTAASSDNASSRTSSGYGSASSRYGSGTTGTGSGTTGTGSGTTGTGSGTTGTGSYSSRFGSGLSSSRYGTSSSTSTPSSGIGRFGSGRSTLGSSYSGYTSRYSSYR